MDTSSTGEVKVMAQIARPVDQDELAAWYQEHGLVADKDGIFAEMPYGPPPVERDQILDQVEKNAMRRDVPNLRPRDFTDKIMVYVGGGPTIREFLDDIRVKCEDPDHYEVYTSNATCKFLLAKGVVPHYHLILDPTEKKIRDIDYEEPVHLVLGLQCHPTLFERAKEKGAPVSKFLAASVQNHDGRSDRELAMKALTPEDHQIMGIGGGSMCGTRMIYFASARGHRRLELYGVDGCVEKSENNLVKCYAYTKPRGENIIETTAGNGRKFFSTMSMARQGEELPLLLAMCPGLDLEIYGDSLMSNQLAIWKEHYTRLALYRITEEYRDIQRQMHLDSKVHYGVGGHRHAPRVFMGAAQIAKKVGKCKVLDYGSGPGTLKKALKEYFPAIPNVWYTEYDLCFPGKDEEPTPAELVVCFDVMEHIEPECVEAVLQHIAWLTKKVAIFIISLVPAHKILPDGRNAHLIVRPPDWWMSWLRKYFFIVERHHDGGELMVVGKPL